MPTLKPRTTITLQPQTHEVIERLALAQGRSRGAIISELLDSVAPALTRTVALLEAAAAAPQQVKDGLRSVVEGVHAEMVATGGDMLKQVDWLMGEFQGGSPGAANPHVVTRGSGIQPPSSTKRPKTRKSPSETKD
jgi:hypothetical protein